MLHDCLIWPMEIFSDAHLSYMIQLLPLASPRFVFLGLVKRKKFREGLRWHATSEKKRN